MHHYHKIILEFLTGFPIRESQKIKILTQNFMCMKAETRDHHVVYQDVAAWMKKKKVNKRKWKHRWWIIGVWAIVIILQIFWIQPEHPKIDLFIPSVIFSFITLLALFGTPLGQTQPMTILEIEAAINKELDELDDHRHALQRLRRDKELAAKLDSSNWSSIIQRARDEWDILQPDIDADLERINKIEKDLDIALAWSRDQNKK